MRLEGDKESLQLQVTVLSEQVEAQAEKIIDLENLLEDKKELLQKTEEQLQKVRICCVGLNSHTLEKLYALSTTFIHVFVLQGEKVLVI